MLNPRVETEYRGLSLGQPLSYTQCEPFIVSVLICSTIKFPLCFFASCFLAALEIKHKLNKITLKKVL